MNPAYSSSHNIWNSFAPITISYESIENMMHLFFPHLFQYHKLSNQIIRDPVVVFPFLFAFFSHLFFSTYTHLLFSSSSIETQWDKSSMTVPSNKPMREEKEKGMNTVDMNPPPSPPFLSLPFYLHLFISGIHSLSDSFLTVPFTHYSQLYRIFFPWSFSSSFECTCSQVIEYGTNWDDRIVRWLQWQTVHRKSKREGQIEGGGSFLPPPLPSFLLLSLSLFSPFSHHLKKKRSFLLFFTPFHSVLNLFISLYPIIVLILDLSSLFFLFYSSLNHFFPSLQMEQSSIISLNVGGHLFSTTPSTLSSRSPSLLSSYIQGDTTVSSSIQTLPDGTIFIGEHLGRQYEIVHGRLNVFFKNNYGEMKIVWVKEGITW